MDDDQRDGFDRIVAMLQAAVDEVETSSTPTGRDLPGIDPNRSSRTILLDGRRGTGKTTLLLTLMDALRYRGSAGDNTRKAHRRLGRSLVWLESLDMEPLDPSTNLLGAVLARLEHMVGHACDAAAARRRDPGILGSWSQEVMQDLADLQARAIAAFDGNLRDRAGRVDPDIFAVESLRAERMRMGLTTRFAGVVSELARTVQQARGTADPPVFVLPVDDLDLNPRGCVPLLELVRAVHSPHLVVIMLADLEVVDTALRLKFQRQFVEAGGREVLDERTTDQAADLAINSRRKHLPREQWVRLAPVDPARALAFHPFDSETDDDLGALLADCRLATDHLRLPGFDTAGISAPHQTLGSLDRQPTTPATDPVERSARQQSTWAEYFRLPMRELVDMHREAARRRDDRKGKELMLAEMAEPRLAPIRDALDRTRVAVVAQPVLGWKRHAAEREGPPVETATIRRWSLPPEAGLGRRDLPAIIAALDMRGVREQYGDDEYQLAPVTLRRTVSTGDNVRVDWPMPQHSTAWALERTAARLAAADRSWASEDPDRLFGAWIATMTSVLLEALRAQPAEVESSWSSVKVQLNTMIEQPIVHQWYSHVLSLCVPEMGMSENQAREMRAQPKGSAFRRLATRADELRRARDLPADLSRLRRRWPRSSADPQ